MSFLSHVPLFMRRDHASQSWALWPRALLQMDVSGFEDAFELSIRLHHIFDCTRA